MKKIKILSPAKSIDIKHIEFAKNYLKTQGFKVEVSAHATGADNYFSGTDKERLDDFQNALDDKTVDFILCSRGGYGSVRIIDQLDFRNIKEKLIIGYSDITVFHNHLDKNFNIHTVHASAPLNFEDNTKESLESLLNVLQGKTNNYSLEGDPANKIGHAEGKMTGGNLSIIASLLGTNSELKTNGKILFIEDLGEPVYSIDRMLWSLKKANKLSGLKALIVGGMTGLKDSGVPFGKDYKEIILDIVQEFNYPVCFNFPAGHIDDNRALVFGKMAKLLVLDDKVVFEQ